MEENGLEHIKIFEKDNFREKQRTKLERDKVGQWTENIMKRDKLILSFSVIEKGKSKRQIKEIRINGC